MHNIKELRKKLKDYKKKLSDRNFDFDINTFEILDNEKEVLLLNDEYASLIENLKNNNKQAKEFLNISFLPDEYEEALARLFPIIIITNFI